MNNCLLIHFKGENLSFARSYNSSSGSGISYNMHNIPFLKSDNYLE